VLPRPFKVSFGPVLPVIGILLVLYLMTDLPGTTWIRFVVWLVIYAAYGYRHSRLRTAAVDPDRRAGGVAGRG
jgi:APA family basic amino acid/polyamine antiporter